MHWLRDQYEKAVEGMTVDIEHITAKMKTETDPRELAALRKIKMEMVDRKMAFIGALESMQ